MVEEIRQDGKVILSSEDGFSVPMIFNNLCGKNFIGKEYKDYIRYIAFGEWDLSRALCPIIGTVFYIRTAQSRNFEQVNQNRNSKNQNSYRYGNNNYPSCRSLSPKRAESRLFICKDCRPT